MGKRKEALVKQVHACARKVIAAGEKLTAMLDDELKENVQCIEHKACKQRGFYESNIINILKKMKQWERDSFFMMKKN